MDSTASMLSPSSSSASSFSFSPLHSPRPLSPSSSSCCSPASSSFSFSPLPSPRPIATSAINCPLKTVTGFPDLDFSSSSSSIWSSPRPFSVPLQPPPAPRSRPPALNISNYAATTAEPSQRRQQQQQQQWAGAHSWVASPRRTHYSLLGVSPLASPREIRLAYRKLALQHHPDVSPLHQLDTSTKLFAEINEAYATLADPQKRACYDLKLALESPVAKSAPLQQHSSPSPRMYTDASGRVYPSMNSFYREWRRGGAHN